MAQQVPSRVEFEDFLFNEVALLDEWRLDEWLTLFSEDATYAVPTAGASDDVDSKNTLFFVADDHTRLRERVGRLNKKTAHIEQPRSLLRHNVSNVRVLGNKGKVAEVVCNFVTYRSKNGVVDTYFGHSKYEIDWSKPAWKINSKRSQLDMDKLYPGKVSILL